MTSYCRVPDCGAPTQGFLCKPCGAELQRAIAELQSYRHELSLLATRQTNVYRANGKPQADDELAELDEEHTWRAARIPAHLRSRDGRIALPQTATMVHLPARDLLTEADNTITTWARVLHEATGTDWPGFTTVAEVLVWLTTNAESFRWHEAAADAHHDFTDLHRRMQRAVDRAPSRVYAGICHAPREDNTRCQAALFAVAGAKEIECDGWRPPSERLDADAPLPEPGCGAVHTADERDAWLRVTLDESLLTFDDAVTVVPKLYGPLHPIPPRSLYRSWVKANRLTIRGVSPDGEPRHSGEELLGLIRNYKPHKYAPRPNRRSA